MKLTIFIVLLSLGSLKAEIGYSQTARLNLNIKDLPIKDVLKKIEDKSEFFFLFNSKIVDVERNITIRVKNQRIDEILKLIFQETDVVYKVIDRQIILTNKAYLESLNLLTNTKKQIIVTGSVTDSTDNQPLPGVNVLIQGTNDGTITDFNGEFSIEVPDANVTLVFSYIGYAPQAISLNGRTRLDVKLAEDARAIEEVVVTALGIKREEKALGYAVQKVSGENIQMVSGVDVATSLTGKVAGLLVTNSSDFAAIPLLTIRGESPLVVIDGVPYQNKSISDISSEDIESISVLKGATASALYGYRGANGAIMITTKKGTQGNTGITVDFTSNTMFTAGFLAIPEKQSLYGRGTNNTYNINSDQAWGVEMDGSNQLQWDPYEKIFKDMPYLPVGKDNFKNFLEQGYVSNNNISIGYNTGNVSLRNSFNYVDNKGQYPNSSLKKYTYSFGGDLDLGKLKMSTNLSYSKKASPNVGSSGYKTYDPMYTLLIWSSADFDILDYKDNYWITKGVQQNYTYGLQPDGTYTGANQNNPYFDRYQKTNEISRDIFNADISVSYEITPWLTATLRTGIDFYKEVGQLRVSQGSYVSTGDTPVPGIPYTWNGARVGAYVVGQSSGFSTNTDFLLTGSKGFDKFNFEYLAGTTVFFNRDDVMAGATSGGISIPEYYSLKASVNSATVSQSLSRRQVNSLFGRLGVSWNEMIFLEFSGRNDWSSTLSETQRAYFYPSISSSFIISELMPGTKNWLDLLKVRASYTISKAIPDIYDINSSYSITSNVWNTLSGAGVPSSLYPTDIIPFAGNTFETGVQGRFLKNRVMFDVSYYDKKMYDYIVNGSISPASGYSGVFTNSDEIRNRRGWEVILNGTPVKSSDWQLDVGVSWSTSKEVYSQLDSLYTPKRPWIDVGERSDVLYSRDLLRSPDGQLIFNNGRLISSAYDSKFGYKDPDWIWGVTANLRYKNFILGMSFDGVVGGLMVTTTESYLWQSGNHPNSLTPERAADVATPGSTNFLGEGVKVVSGTVTYDAFGNITSDTREFAPNDIYTTYKQYVFDLHNSSAWGGNGRPADIYAKTFFKLREISLTFSVPPRYLGKIAKAASVSFIGQNVFLKAKDFKYSDPDGGSENFADPAVRYLGFKLNISL